MPNVVITTPPRISPAIRRLCEGIDATQTPEYVPVRPELGADLDECFCNVRSKAQRSGGKLQFGWVIWEWPSTFIEAEFHAVWISPDGDKIDVTPKKDRESQILFLLDAKRTFDFDTRDRIDNVRQPLANHPDVLDYLELASQRAALISRYRKGKLASIPADEIDPIQNRLDQLRTRLLRRRVGPDEPCPCGSWKKHRRCCGRGR